MINDPNVDPPSEEGGQAGQESVLQYFLWSDAFFWLEMKHFLQQVHKKE